MYKRWTTNEIAYLGKHASDGAHAIAAALNRSVASVRITASRYGISLKQSWMCPRCGREVFTPLSVRSGWCRTCSLEESRDKAVIANRQARLSRINENARVKRLEKERQAVYADTHRVKKRHAESGIDDTEMKHTSMNGINEQV